jgi:hypothetical protein
MMRTILLKPIVDALCPNVTSALPAFHALSGAGYTGSFAGNGKLVCWKVFQNASDEIITAMFYLDTTAKPTEETLSAIEKIVCQPYLPNTLISEVKYLRWLLFRKNQAQYERLPHTRHALYEGIFRAHYQILV